MRKELESRLIKFSVLVYELNNLIDKDFFTTYLIKQLLRSSASAALNYGETQSAELRNDFIHKIGMVLKELRESQVNLMIISGIKVVKDFSIMETIQDECNQLVAIFYKMSDTARKNSR